MNQERGVARASMRDLLAQAVGALIEAQPYVPQSGSLDREIDDIIARSAELLASLAKPSPQGLSPDTSEDTNAP